jgi:addiction module HigA family antidote
VTITHEDARDPDNTARFVAGVPISPGEILDNEFLQELGISQRKLARALRVPPTRISEIIRGKRAISADTAMRLGRYFGTSAELWLRVQAQWELALLHQARQSDYDDIVPHPPVHRG